MIIFHLKIPDRVFVSYDGSINDTAAIVGLYNKRAKVDQILFTGPQNLETLNRVSNLNAWLSIRNWPVIITHSSKSESQLIEVLTCDPLKDWSWQEKECACAIRLAELKA